MRYVWSVLMRDSPSDREAGAPNAPASPRTAPPVEVLEDVQAAGLRYVSDQEPGLRRCKNGKGFTYVGDKGEGCRDQAALKAVPRRTSKAAIEQVAARLGNAVTICRKCYVQPDIIHTYLTGSLVEELTQRITAGPCHELDGLKPEEVTVLHLLEKRLSSRAPSPKPQETWAGLSKK